MAHRTRREPSLSAARLRPEVARHCVAEVPAPRTRDRRRNKHTQCGLDVGASVEAGGERVGRSDLLPKVRVDRLVEELIRCPWRGAQLDFTAPAVHRYQRIDSFMVHSTRVIDDTAAATGPLTFPH